MPSEDRLMDLLLEWEELREQGRLVSAEELCRDCPELIDEVQRRIRFLGAVHADREPEHGLETGSNAPDSFQTLPEDRAAAPCGKLMTLPGYEILGELGRGGMGVVYKARQESLGRVVALKMILAGAHAGPAQLARFRDEAKAAAHLQHSNIVQVYEVGEHDRCPYFSLEFVDGRCLRDAIDEFQQPVKAATLIEQLALAVGYAHERGIIHRDLKPANILLTNDGMPKIADFGLAKRLDDEQERTRTGDILGTPAYMSPEQASGKTKELGPATDIYALGVILYELLTGRPPFQGGNTWAVLNQAVMMEPVPPSLLRGGVPRDLETICLKCLQKAPARRYPSARALAGDLRRLLEGRPIQARPVGWIERLEKWVRRRPAVAALIGVSAAALLALAVGGWVATLKLYQREQALKAQVKATRQAVIRLNVANGKNFLDGENDFVALIWFARALSQEEDKTRQTMHRLRFGAVLLECPRLAHLWFHKDNVNDVAFSPDGLWTLTASADHTARVWNVRTGQPRFDTNLQHESPVLRASFSADGNRVVTASVDKTAKVWDAATGRLIATLSGHQGPIREACFNSDGSRVVTGSDDKTARLWDAHSGQPIGSPLLHEGAVVRVRFHSDGRKVLTASSDGSARLWKLDPAGAVLEARLKHGGPLTDACFDAQGKLIATASEDGTARLWDAATGAALSEPLRHLGPVLSVAFRPDGRQLSTASLGAVQFWDVKTGQAAGVVLRHYSTVNRVSFSPDGTRVVTASDDNYACVWDANTGRPLTPPLIHIGSVQHACFSPDGQRIMTAARVARIYDLSAGTQSVPILKHDGPIGRASFSPDGNRVLTASADGTARVWETRTGKELGVLRGHTQPVFDAAYSLDGRHIATASADATARIWDANTFRLLFSLEGHTAPVRRVAFSPDGDRVITISDDGSARTWDAARGVQLAVLGSRADHTRKGVMDAQFSPDGRWVVTASGDGTVQLWEAASGKPRGPVLAHKGRVLRVALSPDGHRLATACFDGSAQLWDTTTREPVLRTPLQHSGPILDISFSPDGSRVLTCGEDNTARIWSAVNGEQLVAAMRHHGTIGVARFSTDGSRVATASADDTGRVWDAATGEPLTPPLRHQGWGRITDVEFNPSGDRVVTTSVNGTAQLWKMSAPDWPTEDLEQLAELLGGQRIGADAASLVPLDAAELRVRWDNLRSRHPEAFGLNP
ncbi:MAG: protein kinase [Planctomycetes bacterium]|nr:protein kinase [Planctomycetota bacterium]